MNLKDGTLYSACGYGWFEEDNLMLEKDYNKKKYRKILIMQEEAPFDNVITARDVYSGDMAEAVCDTFDFATGARIAFDRLMEKQQKEKLLNCKVICVKAENGIAFEVGKVYRIVDGAIISGRGHECFQGLHSVKELNDRCWSQFIEFKGEV